MDHFEFHPLTQTQAEVTFDFRQGKNLLLTGYAGTGKTYLALALALEAFQNKDIDRICIFRSAVSTRDIGFLPGTEAEKIEVYEKAIKETVNKLVGRGDAYCLMKSKGYISFESTSFQRGMTYDRCCLIVEEAQNLTSHETDTIVTRLGQGSRIILAGDTRQGDIRGSGLPNTIRIVDRMKNHFSHHDFGIDDIVRSEMVRAWIIASAEVQERD